MIHRICFVALMVVFTPVYGALNVPHFSKKNNPQTALFEYYESKLLEKGIRILEENYLNSVEDYERILNHSFDKYRSEKTVRVVEISKAFKVELFSFEDMQAENIEFDQNEYQRKQNEDVIVGGVQSILRLDLGVGQKNFEGQERWVVE